METTMATIATMAAGFRLECDALGELEVPQTAYWGIHTQRALLNFGPALLPVPRPLLRAYAQVKQATLATNLELGYLDPSVGQALQRAAEELASALGPGAALREPHGHSDAALPEAGDLPGDALGRAFPLDALQGGAGTSTHMNINEVLANRALELLEEPRGNYSRVHPLHHVNLHQSTNDTYPTALKLAAIGLFRELAEAVARLQGVCQQKEKAFAGIPKMGRTQLQAAVPMTLGAELSAFAEAFARDRWRCFKCEERLRQVNLGGTAVGTGLGAPRRYIFLATEKLRDLTGLGLCRGENLVDQTANADALVEVAATLQALAANLAKTAGDTRLLHLLGEVRLRALQAGSSHMPGKVNPVAAESVLQAALWSRRQLELVGEGAGRASLQIQELLPMMAWALLGSLERLLGAVNRWARELVALEAGPQACAQGLDGPALVTALTPGLSYEEAGALVAQWEELEGQHKRPSFRAFLEEKLGTERVARALDPATLMALGFREEDLL